VCICCQALHRTEILEKSLADLKKTIEDNKQTQQYTDKKLTRMIVDLDDVSLPGFLCIIVSGQFPQEKFHLLYSEPSLYHHLLQLHLF